MKKTIVLIAALLLCARAASAGGFFIGEQGARAEGMGSAFTAVADDPSALWFNPAGIAFQKGVVGTVGFDTLIPSNKYTSPATGLTYTARKKTFFTPQGYLLYNREDLPVSFGMAINTPFGLSTDWRNSGAPFTTTSSDTVTFSRIDMINYNPSVAFKINDNLSVAAGVVYYQVRQVDLDSAALLLNGNGDGWGGNAALLYRNGPLRFGVSYRSRVKATINGQGVGIGALAALGSAAVSTSVTFPDMVNVGLSFQASNNVLISGEVDWVNWKPFNAINLNFAPSALGTTVVALGKSSIPENWKATTSFRIGTEWAFASTMRARLGYVYDPSPVTAVDFSPRLPGNKRQLFNVGFGFDLSRRTAVDLAYSYVLLNNRNQTASAALKNYNGLYKSHVHVIAASLTHHF